jgi:hypothetical protein
MFTQSHTNASPLYKWNVSGYEQESVERFIENQAFSPSYDLAPPPTPPVSKLSLFPSLPVCRRSRGRSLIIRRRRESLGLYASFNTL